MHQPCHGRCWGFGRFAMDNSDAVHSIATAPLTCVMLAGLVHRGVVAITLAARIVVAIVFQ